MSTQVEARKGLFVGSVPRAIAEGDEATINFLMDACGMGGGPIRDAFSVPSVPLAEDPAWVYWQLVKLGAVPTLRIWRQPTFGSTGNYRGMPLFTGKTIDPDKLDLLFASRVKDGYPVLQDVSKKRGVPTPRLQVGINSLDVAIFGLGLGAKKHLEAFVEATRRETAEIYKRTKGNVFFLVETPCATVLANLSRGDKRIIDWFTYALGRIIAALPEGAAWGFHFCYGDLSNSSIGDHGWLAETLKLYKLLYKPEFTVKLINTLLQNLEKKGYVPELIHIPLAFGKRPPSLAIEDYAAYRNLRIPEGVQIYAGAIHHSRWANELVTLYPKLDEVFDQRVGKATACGLARHTVPQTMGCLEAYRRVANC